MTTTTFRVGPVCLIGVLLCAFFINSAFGAALSWDHPGANRFLGSVPDAVQDYKDIPAPTRAILQSRMEKLDYDDMVLITKHSIISSGPYTYAPEITDMHFGAPINGKSRILKNAGRENWDEDAQERALVYTQDGYTIIVPTVCSNVARAVRLPVVPAGPGRVYPYPPPIVWAPFVPPPFVDWPTLPAPPVYQSTVYATVPMLPPWSPVVPWGYCCSGGPPTVPPIRPPVPEPSTWWLLLAGLAAVGMKSISKR